MYATAMWPYPRRQASTQEDSHDHVIEGPSSPEPNPLDDVPMTVAVSAHVIEDVAIDDLHPDPANPRRISDDELDTLTRSLRQRGFVQPVLARRVDRIVIGGHQRQVAARRLGMTSVPVIWLDISIEQARLLNLALNRISGSWDEQLLARLLLDLQATDEADLRLSGHGEDELKDLLRSLDALEKALYWQRRAVDAEARLAVGRTTGRGRIGSRGRRVALRTAVADLATPVAAAGVVRIEAERRWLDGHLALFAQTKGGWDQMLTAVERLAGFDLLAVGGLISRLPSPDARHPGLDIHAMGTETLARVSASASRYRDQVRLAALDILDDPQGTSAVVARLVQARGET